MGRYPVIVLKKYFVFVHPLRTLWEVCRTVKAASKKTPSFLAFADTNPPPFFGQVFFSFFFLVRMLCLNKECRGIKKADIG